MPAPMPSTADLPVGVRLLRGTLPTEQAHRHDPELGALLGPAVAANHRVDGELHVRVNVLRKRCIFFLERVGSWDDELLYDTPSNLRTHPARLVDLGAFWVEHGEAGLLLLAATEQPSTPGSLIEFTDIPLAHRLAATNTALRA